VKIMEGCGGGKVTSVWPGNRRSGYEDCGLVCCVTMWWGSQHFERATRLKFHGIVCSMTYKILSNNVVRIKPLQLWILNAVSADCLVRL